MKKALKILLLLLSIEGISAQEKCNFFQDKTWGDLHLYNKDRGSGGRIIVPSINNAATINFANDFSGGIYIGGYGSIDTALAYFNATNETFPIIFYKDFKAQSLFAMDNIGIGTTNPQAKLDVRGKIIADEVQIKVNTGADHVFYPEYKLKPLSDVKIFIEENKHLPDIPSEKQMIEGGVGVSEMQIKLLQKIEELTLYIIELKEEVSVLQKSNLQQAIIINNLTNGQ